MNKGKLKSGDCIYWFRMELRVTFMTFSRALTEHFYNENLEFPNKLSKKEGEKILKSRLFFHGISGEYDHGHFDGSFEEGEIFNEIHENASNWVKTNHPHLIQ